MILFFCFHRAKHGGYLQAGLSVSVTATVTLHPPALFLRFPSCKGITPAFGLAAQAPTAIIGCLNHSAGFSSASVPIPSVPSDSQSGVLDTVPSADVPRPPISEGSGLALPALQLLFLHFSSLQQSLFSHATHVRSLPTWLAGWHVTNLHTYGYCTDQY